jgi:SAM-dependent methyltransferase
MDSIEWDRRYGGRELLWTGEPNRFLVAETAALRPGSALDLACGEGRNAVWLAEQGWRVTGVDFSEVALEKARGLADARGVDAGWVAAWLVKRRSAEETARIKAEAIELFGDGDGKLDLEALANGPRTAREEQQVRARRSERDDLLADW